MGLFIVRMLIEISCEMTLGVLQLEPFVLVRCKMAFNEKPRFCVLRFSLCLTSNGMFRIKPFVLLERLSILLELSFEMKMGKEGLC